MQVSWGVLDLETIFVSSSFPSSALGSPFRQGSGDFTINLFDAQAQITTSRAMAPVRQCGVTRRYATFYLG
jgi:hypothetical protein